MAAGLGRKTHLGCCLPPGGKLDRLRFKAIPQTVDTCCACFFFVFFLISSLNAAATANKHWRVKPKQRPKSFLGFLPV